MSAFASEITAAAFDGSAAIRPVAALTVDVSSVRDVPGIDAGNESVIPNADTCRASRTVATTTKVVATKIATGNSTRSLITVLFVTCVGNTEIGERRQVRHVVGADAVTERIVREAVESRGQRRRTGRGLQHDVQHVIADAAPVREPGQV